MDELNRCHLLHDHELLHVDDWKTLFASNGPAAPEARSGQSFNHYIVYRQAILNGDGIGWDHLLDDYISSGRLRRASSLSFESKRGYFCY